MDFLSRLAALVPPSRVHMIKYAGVFAPNHPLRKKLILNPEKKKNHQSKCTNEDEPKGERKKVRNTSWAKLLSRVFQIDVGTCKNCGGEMEIIGAVFDRLQVQRYLDHIGLARPPPDDSSIIELKMEYLPL